MKTAQPLPATRIIDMTREFAAGSNRIFSTALVEALAALHPDEMSPRDALEALYALKAQLAKTKKD